MKQPLCIALLLLGSCARSTWHAPLVLRDTTQADTLRLPASTIIGKLKAGTVILQNGTGNQASQADNRKAGQRQGSAATAPHATSTNSTEEAGTPWYVFAGIAAAGVAVGAWLRGKLPF